MKQRASRKPGGWPVSKGWQKRVRLKEGWRGREHEASGARFGVREQLKIVLLSIPAAFWCGIFLALAGVRPLESIIEGTPETAQALIALGCPLLAVILGVEAAGQARRAGGWRNTVACWATVAAGAALFVFAALISLKQS